MHASKLKLVYIFLVLHCTCPCMTEDALPVLTPVVARRVILYTLIYAEPAVFRRLFGRSYIESNVFVPGDMSRNFSHEHLEIACIAPNPPPPFLCTRQLLHCWEILRSLLLLHLATCFGAVLMDMNRTGVAHGFEPHVLQVCSKVFLMSSTGPYRI